MTTSDTIREVGFVVLERALEHAEVDELRAAFGPTTAGSTLHVDVDDGLARTLIQPRRRFDQTRCPRWW